ncbi:MAG: outer membrane lipoprotein-sorting protein [Candidatus Aminicenantia bacterium]
MRKINLFLVLLLVNSLFVFPQQSQLTSTQILEKVDDTVNAPKDKSSKIKVIIVDKKGREEAREMTMLQKGSDRRLVKFLSPAEYKGIGFLSLPNEVMYVYLPAFGKTRRIASHVKNQKFAGTDFTYEDMEAQRYSEKWISELIKTEGNQYVLLLKPKADTKTQYSKIVMWVRSENFYPSKVELYDKAEKLYKVITMDKLEKIGDYWISKELQMEDLREGRKTIMTTLEIKLDTGLSDKLFTERYLTR